MDHTRVTYTCSTTFRSACYNLHMTSPTTHKGNIGSTAVALEALKKGYHVSIPMEGASYDLIIDKGGNLFRVQVKYVTSVNDVVAVRLRDYHPTSIDAMIAYDGNSGQTYWLPMTIVAGGKNAVNLRLRPAKNGQERGVSWARDFTSW